VHCFSVAIQIQRGDTKANVERKQGMTERERQQELEQLYSEQPAEGTKDEDDASVGKDKIHNPLKLPLARSDSGSPGYNECSGIAPTRSLLWSATHHIGVYRTIDGLESERIQA
jgi:hypothetical protein